MVLLVRNDPKSRYMGLLMAAVAAIGAGVEGKREEVREGGRDLSFYVF
jgi:hypothetical protein